MAENVHIIIVIDNRYHDYYNYACVLIMYHIDIDTSIPNYCTCHVN